jgi:hypothetical protein
VALGGGGLSTRDFHVQDAPGPDAGGSGASDIKSRFFEMGPTSIYSILGAIDDRIRGIEMQTAAHRPACLDQEPVAFSITPFGQALTFYAQCYQQIGSSSPGDPGFVQFGQKDGVTYYYSAVGAGWTAATLTPTGDGGADQLVRAWSSVGVLNAATCGDKTAFDDCSYGVIQLVADPSAHGFEMAVAGVGFGYCGAQLRSDGVSVYQIGSADMASTCGDPVTVCVSASDATTPATCEGAVATFALTPLGRTSSVGPHAGGPGVDAGPDAAWAASAYPGGAGDSVKLDGASDDAVHFGPTSPSPGVGKM